MVFMDFLLVFCDVHGVSPCFHDFCVDFPVVFLLSELGFSNHLGILCEDLDEDLAHYVERLSNVWAPRVRRGENISGGLGWRAFNRRYTLW